MARYNTVSVDGLYFSSDGTSTGRMCKLDTLGLDALTSSSSRVTHIPIQGPGFTFTCPNEAQIVRVKAYFMANDVHEDFIDEMEIATDTETQQRMIISGNDGYDLYVDPYYDPATMLSFSTSGKMRNEILHEVTYSWIVRSIN